MTDTKGLLSAGLNISQEGIFNQITKMRILTCFYITETGVDGEQ